jgi:hypothetical protein
MGWACVMHDGDENYISVRRPGRKRLFEGHLSVLEK